jgi:hypothetical protein
MTRSPALLSGFACIVLAACAPQPAAGPQSAASGRECFHAGSVCSFHPFSDEVVDIQVGARRYYRLQLFGTCPGVNWRTAVALRTRGGSSWICQGMDAELIVPEPGIGPQRCLVQSVRRLSDAEARALRYYR